MNKVRFVVDTNVLVSRLLAPQSIPAQAVRQIINQGIFLLSHDTFTELSRVLNRRKFDAYISIQNRQRFLQKLELLSEKVEIIQKIEVCRDQSDNKFLELAVNGNADFLVTGDQDLLVLHPFQDISILTPAQFLELNL